jgi:hypothetical protein
LWPRDPCGLILAEEAHLARIASAPFAVSVVATTADVPYELPTAGGKRELVVPAGTRFLSEVRPPWHTSPGAWSYALVNCYGGGAFTPELTAGGAYVLGGQGGHNAPMVMGVVHFDFTTGLWAPYVHATDAEGTPAPERFSPDYQLEDLAAEPVAVRDDKELTGYVELPLPDHSYQLQLIPPRAHTGGTLHMIRAVTTAVTQSAHSGSRSHQVALEGASAGRWSRASANRLREVWPGADPLTETEAAYDPTDRRIYFSFGFPQYWNLAYLDLNDATWKMIAIPEAERLGIAGGPRSIFVDDERRLLVVVTQSHIGFLDLTATEPAWRLATVSGEWPHGEGTGQGWRGRMDKYPRADGGDDCWYHLWGRGTRTNSGDTTPKEKAHQQFLWKLAIPSDPITGTWEWSTFTPTTEDDTGGITAAHEQDWENGGGIHYTRFFYVPAIRCFAWIPRPDSNVELIKP